MPRGKKTQESSKRKTKKVVDDEDFEEEIVNDDEEQEELPKKKSSKKPAAKSKTPKKNKKSDPDEEDDLSDLDVDDEDTPAIESADNDTVVSQRHERTPPKIIDPKTPIGQLKTDDILSYLIQVGSDTLNPQLKYGALNLLKQLTGRVRRPQQQYGSKSNRNGFNQRTVGGFAPRGGNGGNNGRNQNNYTPNNKNKHRSQQKDNNDDLYDDQE